MRIKKSPELPVIKIGDRFRVSQKDSNAKMDYEIVGLIDEGDTIEVSLIIIQMD